MTKKTFPIILFVLITTSLFACNPSVTRQTDVAATPSDGYPVITSQSSSYPAPDTGQITPLPKGTLPDAPKDAPQAEPNKGSISGVLFSYTTFVVLPKTEFFLIPAVGPEKKDIPPVIAKPDPSKGDVLASTDEKGNVRLNNVPPGNYYMVIWAPMSWIVAQVSEQNSDPLLIEVKANKRLPLGVIYVSWP